MLFDFEAPRDLREAKLAKREFSRFFNLFCGHKVLPPDPNLKSVPVE